MLYHLVRILVNDHSLFIVYILYPCHIFFYYFSFIDIRNVLLISGLLNAFVWLFSFFKHLALLSYKSFIPVFMSSHIIVVWWDWLLTPGDIIMAKASVTSPTLNGTFGINLVYYFVYRALK